MISISEEKEVYISEEKTLKALEGNYSKKDLVYVGKSKIEGAGLGLFARKKITMEEGDRVILTRFAFSGEKLTTGQSLRNGQYAIRVGVENYILELLCFVSQFHCLFGIDRNNDR